MPLSLGSRYEQRRTEVREATVATWQPRRKTAAAKAKVAGRSGAAVNSAAFERLHPRGRGGLFIQAGSSGREVRAVQRKVAAKPDGKFGPQTAAAVRRFQRAHGLQVDGVVGHQTAQAIAGRKGKAKVGALTAHDRHALASAGRPKRKSKS